MSKMFEANKVHMIDFKIKPKETIKQIIKDGQEDCFYLCNLSDIVQKHKNWTKAMPRVKTFYAVKSNDDKMVLKTLIDLGAGFDCASMKEISTVLDMGVETDRIIFAMPTKIARHLSYAKKVGVTCMTFDSEEEAYKIKQFYPEANLVLRIRYDNKSAKYVLGNKFGVDPDNEAEELLYLAKDLKLNVVGVAFHTGSSGTNFSIFTEAIAASRRVFDVAIKVGFDMKLLDIGGGYPGNDVNFAFKLAEIVNPALDIYFPDESVKIIAEPGRYYIDSAFTLATKIIGSRNTTDKRMYYVDASVYNSLNPVIFGDSFPVSALNNDSNNVRELLSIVWGATCDSTDKICDNVYLPFMNLNDWIVFDNTGAYTITLACHFNGISLPEIFYVVYENLTLD